VHEELDATNVDDVAPKRSDKVQISVRLTSHELEALERRAAKYRMTIAEVIREWARSLEEYEPYTTLGKSEEPKE